MYFSNVKHGELIYDIKYGEGIVEDIVDACILDCNYLQPGQLKVLKVKFLHPYYKNNYFYYTLNGISFYDDANQTLYYKKDNPKVILSNNEINYINLTAGIEWINSKLIKENNYNFVYFKSSHLESKNYLKFLKSIPDDMLINLAIGKKIIIYEASSNEIPKLFKIGQHLIKYVLYSLWFNKKYYEANHLKDHYIKLLQSIDKDFKNKVNYYKKFLVVNDIDLSIKYLIIKKENTEKIINNFVKGLK